MGKMLLVLFIAVSVFSICRFIAKGGTGHITELDFDVDDWEGYSDSDFGD